MSLTYLDGGKRAYHALSRDVILNEIIRRVDQKGRLAGEIMKEDIIRKIIPMIMITTSIIINLTMIVINRCIPFVIV